ncbi:glycosyltransferase family 9 protein [Candidatus Woesearchaeota archaeon]|nr:glycosyltransferase family 9 protein [Candidatus Woesearchaeota archaeon]
MVAIIKFIDRYIGNFVCNFLGLFKAKKNGNKLKIDKILVVQLWGIGETVLTLPSIEALRKDFPNAEVNVLATSRNKDVYFSNKNISRIITIKLNPLSILGFVLKNVKKYDLVIDMEEYLNISAIISFFAGRRIIGYSHNSRAKLYDAKIKYNDRQHAAQTFLDLVRSLGIVYNFEKLPRLNFSKSDRNLVDKFLKDNGIKSNDFVACVAPGAAESAKARMWPYDKYAELCDEIIAKHDVKIIFVGALNENEAIDNIQKKMDKKGKTINAAGKVALNQLFYLISKCKLFIGNDSGPMHVAAAQGIKTLGLFGPNLPVRFGPYGKGNIGLYKGYNCEFSPCINVHKGQVPDCLYPRNSNDYQKCMKNISIDDVLKEVEKLV